MFESSAGQEEGCVTKVHFDKWGQNTKAVINRSNVMDAAVVHISVLAELHVYNKHFLLVKSSVF